MSFDVTEAIWDRTQQRGEALIVLLALGTFSDKHGRCWPSQKTLAGKARMTERSVQRIIPKLILGGDIEVVQQGGTIPSHGRSSTVYRITSIAKKDQSTPDRMSPLPPTECQGYPRQNVALPPTECRVTPDTMSALPPTECRGNLSSEQVNEPVNESGSAISVLKERVGRMFRREPSLRWSNAEIILLMTVATLETSQADLDALTGYYRAAIPAEKDYRRRTVAALLENWHGELDRARGWVREVVRRSMSIL